MHSLISPLTNKLREELKTINNQRIITAFPRFEPDRWIYEFGKYYNERARTLGINQPFAKLQAECNYWKLHSTEHADLTLVNTGPQKELYQRADKETILRHEKEGLLAELTPGDAIFYDHPQILGVEYKPLLEH